VTNNSDSSTAVIFSDNVGTSLANPFTSSAVDGVYEFYAENGRYDVTVAKVGYDTETISDINLFDGDEAVESYANDAALKAITLAPQTTNTSVKGYYTDGDGGGGDFYWDSTSTETDNGGTIIKATAITTGRWKRLFSGTVNVKWFGAKGDGTDDAAAVNAAITDVSASTSTNELINDFSNLTLASAVTLLSNVNFKNNGGIDLNSATATLDRKSTRLNSSHPSRSRMPPSA